MPRTLQADSTSTSHAPLLTHPVARDCYTNLALQRAKSWRRLLRPVGVGTVGRAGQGSTIAATRKLIENGGDLVETLRRRQGLRQDLQVDALRAIGAGQIMFSL